MSTLKVGTIQDHANSNTAITIDSSGNVLAPVNPKFSVRLSANTSNNDYTTSATTAVPFDTEDFDVGNCMEITNNVAVFTAPVTGYYQFNYTITFQAVEASGHTNVYISIDNDVTTAAADDHYRTIEDPQGGTYQTNTGSNLIYLTANQTVQLRMYINGDSSAAIRRGSRFQGFLVP